MHLISITLFEPVRLDRSVAGAKRLLQALSKGLHISLHPRAHLEVADPILGIFRCMSSRSVLTTVI